MKTKKNLIHSSIYPIVLLCMVFLSQTGFSQTAIVVNPKTTNIIITAQPGNDIMAPIEFDLTNTTGAKITHKISVKKHNEANDGFNRFSENEWDKVKILNEKQDIEINAGATVAPPNKFLFFIPKEVSIIVEKIVIIRVMDGKTRLATLTVTVQPMDDVLSLSDYLSQKRLNHVVKVESNDNILTVGGFQRISDNKSSGSIYQKRKIRLENREVLAIKESGAALRKGETLPLSLVSIPFKIRPKISEAIKRTASSGVTNLGLNLDLLKVQLGRYFSTGKKATHKLALGIWVAPSVEELDSLQTKGYLKTDEKNKQLFVSSGVTISYSYNDISFIFIPAGWDFKTSTIGKNWIYNGKRWWGFGIGISPRIFGAFLNK